MKKIPPKRRASKPVAAGRKPAKGPAKRSDARALAARTVARLRERLRDAEATLEAIRTGQVDALVVQGPMGEQVFTLKGADHRYRQLVETMNEGALLLAADGTIVYGNARFAGLVKLPLEKMIGAQIRAYVSEASQRTLEALLQGRGGSSAKAELEIVATDGVRVPAYLSATESWNEDQKLTCVIVTDLAEQKRSQAIVASERLAALILDQAAEGIVVCDVAGKVVRTSQAADRAAAANPLLRPFEEAFALTDEAGVPVARTIVDAALRGETISGVEAILPGSPASPQQHVLLVSAGPLLNAGGELERRPLGCVVSFVDITERKGAAVERQSLLREANAARLEAEAANQAKDQFLAMLGHELRNPLAPILTALQLMRLRSDETFRGERAVIERQVKHVVTLVDDLLDVSRITRGKIDLELRRIDLVQAVGKAIEQASPLIEGRNHQLIVDVPSGLWLDADEIRLAQVLANLLTNAAKYTERGGHNWVQARRDGEDIVASVRDDGAGIPAEILPSLFDMFVQGKRTIDRSEGGLGLGLAIVRSMVALHGGKVSAYSAGVGQGSRFEIRLQAAPTTSDELPIVRAAAKEPAGLRILVVDDNGEAADALAARLVALGHQTRVAYDGPSALAVAAAFRPDVALLDTSLPALNDFQLARRLRTLGTSKIDLRLIAVTGYGQEAGPQRDQPAGFDGHLVKPVGVDALDGMIRHLR